MDNAVAVPQDMTGDMQFESFADAQPAKKATTTGDSSSGIVTIGSVAGPTMEFNPDK